MALAGEHGLARASQARAWTPESATPRLAERAVRSSLGCGSRWQLILAAGACAGPTTNS